MVCVPVPRVVVLQVTVLALALPVGNVSPLHTAVPSEVNATVPVGATPVTVAVNATIAPKSDGFGELESVVVVASCRPSRPKPSEDRMHRVSR